MSFDWALAPPPRTIVLGREKSKDHIAALQSLASQPRLDSMLQRNQRVPQKLIPLCVVCTCRLPYYFRSGRRALMLLYVFS